MSKDVYQTALARVSVVVPTRGNGNGGHHDLQEPAGVEHGAGEDGVLPHSSTTRPVARKPGPALALANMLQTELERLNIPAHVLGGDDKAAVSLWPHLVALTNGQMIFWKSPYPSARGTVLWTLAWAPATAATRLMAHYLDLVKQPLPQPLHELVLLTVGDGGDER
ncbi:hypothetical protein JYK22_40665, partial [Nonomuraea sp. RK-328]|nr:hypothetical protein [Nonomuraea sp. RK-328]